LTRHFRALIKFTGCLGHLLHGLWTIGVRFPNSNALQKREHIRQWACALMSTLGVKLDIIGKPEHEGPLLVVCNHISWLDIIVLLAVQPVRFVSKSDVKRWPVIGALATGAGTLYIERESRRDALRVVHHIAEALRGQDPAGSIIAVFPEGTTSDGRQVLPFHANLIQSAISAQAPVQAITLRFIDQATDQTSLAPAYIGDETLLGSIWRFLTSPPITAQVHFQTPQSSEGRDRRTWAADLRNTVARQIE
jgi:1-acyl-sn-glycerol-3-phosphate acyltransferase